MVRVFVLTDGRRRPEDQRAELHVIQLQWETKPDPSDAYFMLIFLLKLSKENVNSDRLIALFL